MRSCRTSRAAAGAERVAHGQLAAAARAARQQQAGDVRAGDEQHEADGAEQHEQRRSHVADERVLIRAGDGALAVVGVGILAGEPLRDRPQLGVGLRHRDVWTQAAMRLEVLHVALAAADRLRSKPATSGPSRGASIHRSTSDGMRRNASGITPITVVGMPFSRIVRPTMLGSRAEVLLPDVLRERPRCAARSGRRSVSAVGAADERRQTEHVEERRRSSPSREPHRLAAAREIDDRLTIAGERREAAAGRCL